MLKTKKSLTLISFIGFLSAISPAASADSLNVTPIGPAALRALFHNAETNVVDDLNTYDEDLSAYGTSRPPRSVNNLSPSAATSIDRTAAPELDPVVLRALFHSAGANVVDDLDDYAEEFSDVIITNRSAVAPLLQ